MSFSKKQVIWLTLSAVSFVSFIVFTLLVKFVDVDQVGLSYLNQFFWQRCGSSHVWEKITDVIGYLVILAMLAIVAWQIAQWIYRKNLFRIDKNLLILDLVFGLLVVVYLFFEIVVINYRPELDHGIAKASYPSSHAMLFATVLPLLIWQVWCYLKSKPWCVVLTICLTVVLVIGLIGRLFAGVHWFTDIVAGILISCCFICLYLGIMKK